MLHKRRTRFSRFHGGFYQFESLDQRRAEGFGDVNYVRLRDTDGNIWQGAAETECEVVRYRFRDSRGRVMTGVADGSAIVLRDDRGMMWRGYVQ